MTDDLLDRMEALCQQATPGPWTLNECSHGGNILRRGGEGRESIRHPQTHLQVVPSADAAFIAACREAVPALVARCRAAEGRTKMLEKDVESLARELGVATDALDARHHIPKRSL